MLKNGLFFFLTIFFVQTAISQQWIDSKYDIEIHKDSIYGYSIDYTGKEQALRCDIAFPINDTIPECGRPLVLVVHGGSFLAGNKEEYDIQLWMKEFAKKGYVAVAINYRLGMFQTEEYITCAVQDWGCLNMADSAEWYRGNYRGMQDCRGAIRYMISNKDQFNIDPNNVFLIGESAGGFITMASAYLDDESERSELTKEIAEVSAPAMQYQNACVPPEAFPIGMMDLRRPDLGGIQGTIHLENNNYRIKGVASFFGGIMNDFLASQDNTYPLSALYMYAQPNDLIVPFGRSKVMAGLSACAVQYSGCNYLKNVPEVYGNGGIRNLIVNNEATGVTMPTFKAEFTENYADCLLQGLFPGLTGHAVDDIFVRTKSLAAFFAKQIGSASDCLSSNKTVKDLSFEVYPNPGQNVIQVKVSDNKDRLIIEVLDMSGHMLARKSVDTNSDIETIDMTAYGKGFFIIKLIGPSYIASQRIIIQ